MKRTSQLGIALGAVLAMAACAGGASTETSTSAQTSTTQSTASAYTDAQVRAYVTARSEIEPIQRTYGSLSAEQRTQATAQITQIMQRHGFTAVTYNALETRARTDQDLANRISALSVSGEFTDVQLRSFVTASRDITPITQGLTTATPEQQAQASTQIREILQRNNLNSDIYNGIAARAQTDQALAARIAALQVELSGTPETPAMPPEPGQ